tara:strand:- start:1963 stop:2841 length:879 start_codon:yes stop_codon:yes gene_type:complete
MGVISDIKAFIELVEKYKQPKRQEEENVATRFIKLFEKHGIYRNQIPRYFDHGLSLDDVSSTDKLLTKLNHETLKAAAKLFSIRIEWLEGADDELYELHDFYKHPEDYRAFLEQLVIVNNKSYRLRVKLIISSKFTHNEDALLILEEPIADLGENQIVRYHLCGGWNYEYFKCRADIAACIGISDQLKVNIPRVLNVNEYIGNYCEGRGFIPDLYDFPLAYKRNHFFKKTYNLFHLDELLSDPRIFVDDVRDGLWGKTSALELWLNYYDQGFMDTKYISREVFSKYLEELQK